jgi:outer membrane protein assembly factor BamB
VKGTKIIIVIILLNAIFLGLAPTMGSEETAEGQVEVMIDFGNGVVKWAEVELETNDTAIDATEKACLELNMDVVVIWGIWGGFVSTIEGQPADYNLWWWTFLIWNDTQDIWEMSWVGASSVVLKDGDVIGWSPNSSSPISTPHNKYLWPSFQANGHNLGVIDVSGPETNSVEWIFDTKTKELAASPAIVQDRVAINNWGGTFYLDKDGLLVWQNSEVKGAYSPVIGYDNVLVGGKDGYLYSLNKTNGEINWKTQITQNPGLSGVAAPPKIVKGKVYVGSYDFTGGAGYLYCLDEKTGAVLWKNTTLSSVYFSSPAVGNDKVYIGTMGLYNSSGLDWKEPYGVFCFDSETGRRIWSFSVDGSVGSSPTIVDGKLIFTSKDGYLYCLNIEEGNLIWKKNIGSSVSSPAVYENTIFVGSGEMNGEGMFYSLDPDGNILWEFEPNGAVQSSPAVAGDYVYFASNVKNGTIYCLNREDGNLVWQYKPWPEEYIISSPAVVDGRLYIASDNGRLYCFGGKSPNIIVDEEGITEIIHVGEDIKVVLKDEEFGLTIRSIEENNVIVEIESQSKTIEVKLGKSEKVDIDGDGAKDLLITANSADVSLQSTSITFEDFSESQEEDMLVYYIIVIMIIGMAIVFLLLLWQGKNNK